MDESHGFNQTGLKIDIVLWLRAVVRTKPDWRSTIVKILNLFIAFNAIKAFNDAEAFNATKKTDRSELDMVTTKPHSEGNLR